LLDMTTAVAGPLCWWDFHPLERQLDSLHQTSQPRHMIGDIKGLAKALPAGGHISRGEFQASGGSRFIALQDYAAISGNSASPWGDDVQSLPLFSGFMNPPPAYAPSPYSKLACEESQMANGILE
jgi:hypothetical protein